MNDIIRNMRKDDWTDTPMNGEEFSAMLGACASITEFFPVRSKDIRVITAAEVENPVDEEIHKDTVEHTELYVQADNRIIPVGESAMTSLFNTAMISGQALSKVMPKDLAQILNTCLDVAREYTSLMIRGDKVRAFLGAHTYQYAEQKGLNDRLQEALVTQFGTPRYRYGSISHTVTEVVYELPEVQNELTQIYQESVSHSLLCNTNKVMPCVKLMTSDTGHSSIRMMAYFTIHGNKELLTPPMAIRHKASCDAMEDFTNAAFDLYAQFKATAQAMEALDKVTIAHPANCFKLLCKKLAIPKRYGCAVEEQTLAHIASNATMTALDVYSLLLDCAQKAQDKGASRKTVMQIKEIASRAINCDFAKYDLPGVHSW